MTVADLRWDITLPIGERAERLVEDLFTRSFAGLLNIEVKNDRVCADTGKLYVEFECLHADGQWRPSGVQTSEADYWAFVLADTHGVIMLPLSMVRHMAREQGRDRRNVREVAAAKTKNPTRGVVISLAALPKLAYETPWTTP